MGNPFDEVRKEILQKKQERGGLKEDSAEIPMERKMVRENEGEKISSEGNDPNHFQDYLKEQDLQIQRKKKEAKRLIAQVEEIKNGHLGKKSLQSSSSSLDIPEKVSEKVRSVLKNKGDIKAALITGEILAKPLAFRTGQKAKSVLV